LYIASDLRRVAWGAQFLSLNRPAVDLQDQQFLIHGSPAQVNRPSFLGPGFNHEVALFDTKYNCASVSGMSPGYRNNWEILLGNAEPRFFFSVAR